MLDPNDPRLVAIQLRKELLATGYDDAAIAYAVRSGVLGRVRRGAYADARVLGQLNDVALHAVRARAAAKQAKVPVVISHASAIAMYPDAPAWGLDLGHVHLTRKDGKTGRADAGIRQHRGRLLEGDIITIGDVEVTAPTRALLEVTTQAPVEVGVALANHLLHHGIVTMDQVVERYRQSIDHWPRTLPTDLVLRLADGRIESVGESRTYYFCFRQGLPLPMPQYEVRSPDGTLVARLDFAWPDKKVWLEFDGRMKYQELLKDGESPTDVVLREKKRQEAIEHITGWRCIRITWDDLFFPERLAARIRAAFAEMAA